MGLACLLSAGSAVPGGGCVRCLSRAWPSSSLRPSFRGGPRRPPASLDELGSITWPFRKDVMLEGFSCGDALPLLSHSWFSGSAFESGRFLGRCYRCWATNARGFESATSFHFPRPADRRGLVLISAPRGRTWASSRPPIITTPGPLNPPPGWVARRFPNSSAFSGVRALASRSRMAMDATAARGDRTGPGCWTTLHVVAVRQSWRLLAAPGAEFPRFRGMLIGSIFFIAI